MTEYVYLDGELTESDKINIKEHKFIGLFRFPSKHQILEFIRKTDTYTCPCGKEIFSDHGDIIHEHWQLGHFDLPQYMSIK